MALVLSIIGIAALLLSIIDAVFAAPVFEISPWFFPLAIICSILFEVAIDGFFAIVTKCFPDKWVDPEKSFYQVSKKEQKFYEKLGVRRWKDKYIELGWMGGFSKKKIVNPSDPKYIHLFMIESNKGFLDHLFGMFFGFAVVLIFPLKFAFVVGIPVAVVNFVLNLMPNMILRYNIPKLQTLYKRSLRNKEREEGLESSQITEK